MCIWKCVIFLDASFITISCHASYRAANLQVAPHKHYVILYFWLHNLAEVCLRNILGNTYNLCCFLDFNEEVELEIFIFLNDSFSYWLVLYWI